MPKPPGDSGHVIAPDGEGVEPNDRVASHTTKVRAARWLGWASAAPQPVIEHGGARMEIIDLVLIRQRRRRPLRPAHSQDAASGAPISQPGCTLGWYGNETGGFQDQSQSCVAAIIISPE